VSLPPPFHTQIVSDTKKVSKEWTSWFQGVSGGGKVFQPSVGGSPYVYQNTTQVRQQAIVSVNTITGLALSRDGTNYYAMSTVLGNAVVLFPGDYLKITYGGSAPTLTIFPI